MAFFANHAGLTTQEGVDEAPINYTPSVGEAHIGQGVGPSSQLNQQESSFPYAQSSQYFADLPMNTQDMEYLMQVPTDYTSLVEDAHIGQEVGPSSQLNQQRSSFTYVQPSQCLAELPVITQNVDTLMQGSSHPYSDSHTNVISFLGEQNTLMDTIGAPLYTSATTYISSPIETNGAFATPTPLPALPVAQESSVHENVAESAELRGTRRTEEDWAKQRSTIRELYMDKNMALPTLMKVMKDKHGFCATQKRYKEKFKAWGFEKNLTRKQSKYITRTALRRLDEGKKTEFHLKGTVIPQDKIDRHLAKSNIRRSPTGSAPSGVSYQTVRPDSQSLVSRRSFTRQSQSLVPGGSSTQQSQQLMLFPSHPQRLSPAINQHQRVDDRTTTREPTLQWQGLNLEALRDLHNRATTLANQGHEHEKARMMFWEAMDGLESLVGAAHPSTLEVLVSFVNFCSKAGFFDEAKDRMQKSLADHQAQLGDLHPLTLMSMAHLGFFYLARKQFGNGELILVRAKVGLEDVFRNDPEKLFNRTVHIGVGLADMYEEQGDFEKSEHESLLMIRKAEALQGPYELEALRLKHALVHRYKARPQEKDGRTEIGIPFLKIEQLLLECIEACEYTSSQYDFNICSFELLREQYHTRGEDLKLRCLLVRVVHSIEAVERTRTGYADVDTTKLRRLQQGLARSYIKLGDRKSAEWWYLRLQPELESYHGVNSRAALENLIQTALFYLGQDDWNEAEPYFRDAQRRAEIVLEQDDPIKERIERCLTTRVYKSECPSCLL